MRIQTAHRETTVAEFEKNPKYLDNVFTDFLKENNELITNSLKKGKNISFVLQADKTGKIHLGLRKVYSHKVTGLLDKISREYDNDVKNGFSHDDAKEIVKNFISSA